MIIMLDGHEQDVPVRVVMNNNTLSAFSGFKFEDMRKSFAISKTKLLNSQKHKNCFDLEQGVKNRATFCDFGMESTPNFLSEWQYDFNLFKYQCHEEKQVANVTFVGEMKKKLDGMKVTINYIIFRINLKLTY